MKTVAQTKQMMVRSVRRGAKALDSKRLGWHHEINLNTLDVRQTNRCIVGQLRNHLHFNDMDASLGFALYEDDVPENYRLHKEDNKEAWYYLNDLWIKEILRRRRAS